VASFSSRGDGDRNPDLVAPGAHIASLLVPGSTVDKLFGGVARTADGMFRGSGTSQAAAVVTGAAALLLGAHPGLAPDQVKSALTGTADDLGLGARSQGAGLLDLRAALAARPSTAPQTFPRSDGTGSLEAARSSAHVRVNGVELRGERDWTGQNWGSQNWGSQNSGSQNWASQNWASQNWADDSWS
ncbi:MAG: peptidase and in kexin sedolisin, partial [Frankiales bacterium]|nr:peptidase and in kexin sedolisin [Frankiales bacterium]